MDFRLDLPFHDPVVVFTLLLLVILVAPILFGKVKVPSIIGLILSGTAIGPYGLNLIDRSEAIVLFGTVGLLYIMFLAGLEIDLAEFKKNKNKSFLFGFFSFSIPMGLGYSVFYYAFGYSAVSSILVASMFASHTLITYPIVTKFDITKNLAVNVAIGGTLIVNLAALMVLAVVVASTVRTVSTKRRAVAGSVRVVSAENISRKAPALLSTSVNPAKPAAANRGYNSSPVRARRLREFQSISA